MGHKTLARQRAIGAVGPARVSKLESAGLLVVDREEHDKAVQRRAELEQEVQRLKREAALALVGEIK